MYNTLTTYLLQWFLLVFTVNYGIPEVKEVHYDPLKTATLTCTTSANIVFWISGGVPVLTFRDGKVITSSDKRYTLIHTYETERNLQIDMVKKQDAGNYTCRIVNGSIAEYHLVINYAAEIPDNFHEKNKEVAEFSTVGLWCNATGIPTPKTSWYIMDGEEHTLGITGRYLEVRNITRGCSATYRCKAENRLNNDSPAVADIRVNAVYPPEVDISLDEPVKNVDNFTFDDNRIEYTVYYKVPETKLSVVKLSCHVDANPNATITWKVGEQVIADYTSEVKTETDWGDSYLYAVNYVNGALQIQISANGDHRILFSRPYECVSTNKVGTDRCSIRFERVY